MTTRQRVAHTATFLQTFHTGQTTAARRADAGAEGSEPRPAPADAEAIAFVTGRPVAAQPSTVRVERDGLSVTIPVGPQFASEKQVAWMLSIAATRELPSGATVESLLIRLEQGFARSAASEFITRYKDLPKKVRVTAAMAEAIAPGASIEEIEDAQAERPKVADGRYAIEHQGVLKFYRVKNGRIPGYVFLNVQASDEWHPIRNRQSINEIIGLIAADELSAARRYGIELGKCSRCGRTLTDETSRAYGIGPDCRNK